MQRRAYAKVNIFLKITGYKNGYHTLLSRFMLVKSLYDTISFVPADSKSFTIDGCDGIEIRSNTIYRAYEALLRQKPPKRLREFFRSHKVRVEKNIPSQAGLGGGSSDAAAFLLLANEVCSLGLEADTLSAIGASVGADVPFFVHGFESANVSGFGEVVEPFEEDSLQLEIFTPDIACDTAEVYRYYNRELLGTVGSDRPERYLSMKSRDILEMTHKPATLNDLYPAALAVCDRLKQAAPEGWFFSGSGSSFFRMKREEQER